MSRSCSIIVLFLLGIAFFLHACASRPRSEIEILDNYVLTRYQWQAERQAAIDTLRASYSDTMSLIAQYELCGLLNDAYRSFNVDSQAHYTRLRVELARRMHNPFYTQLANLNQVEIYMLTGAYYEAITLVQVLEYEGIYSELKPYYYQLSRTLYGHLADFSQDSALYSQYSRKTMDFRDSLLSIYEPHSFMYDLIAADRCNAMCLPDSALAVLQALSPESYNDKAASAMTQAYSYRLLNNPSDEKTALIRAAENDLRGAIREYIALRELAVLLYKEGDINRAYRYICCAMEDARACHVRIRSYELSAIYPIIEQSHQNEVRRREQMGYMLLAGIGIIVLLLIAFLIMRSRQVRQLSAAHQSLKESNQIKAVYIGHYMQVYSFLIDRFDNYRRELYRLAQNQKYNQIETILRSQRFTQEQVNAFYSDFDEAFLHIFPDFIEKMQDLMQPDVEFRMKAGEKLNTDLRVYALVRLGITDSRQIAEMLRYSVSTIFNVRTRMRNQSRYPKDVFEDKVAVL